MFDVTEKAGEVIRKLLEGKGDLHLGFVGGRDPGPHVLYVYRGCAVGVLI